MTAAPIQDGQLEAVAALERACFPDAWTEQALNDALSVPGTELLVCAPEGTVAGYILTRTSYDDSELFRVAVAPEARRSGLGAALLDAALDRAKARGARRMLLEVRASNEPALALYRKLGFTELARRKNYYTAPREDAVIMECRWQYADTGN